MAGSTPSNHVPPPTGHRRSSTRPGNPPDIYTEEPSPEIWHSDESQDENDDGGGGGRTAASSSSRQHRSRNRGSTFSAAERHSAVRDPFSFADQSWSYAGNGGGLIHNPYGFASPLHGQYNSIPSPRYPPTSSRTHGIHPDPISAGWGTNPFVPKLRSNPTANFFPSATHYSPPMGGGYDPSLYPGDQNQYAPTYHAYRTHQTSIRQPSNINSGARHNEMPNPRQRSTLSPQYDLYGRVEKANERYKEQDGHDKDRYSSSKQQERGQRREERSTRRGHRESRSQSLPRLVKHRGRSRIRRVAPPPDVGTRPDLGRQLLELDNRVLRLQLRAQNTTSRGSRRTADLKELVEIVCLVTDRMQRKDPMAARHEEPLSRREMEHIIYHAPRGVRMEQNQDRTNPLLVPTYEDSDLRERPPRRVAPQPLNPTPFMFINDPQRQSWAWQSYNQAGTTVEPRGTGHLTAAGFVPVGESYHANTWQTQHLPHPPGYVAGSVPRFGPPFLTPPDSEARSPIVPGYPSSSTFSRPLSVNAERGSDSAPYPRSYDGRQPEGRWQFFPPRTADQQPPPVPSRSDQNRRRSQSARPHSRSEMEHFSDELEDVQDENWRQQRQRTYSFNYTADVTPPPPAPDPPAPPVLPRRSSTRASQRHHRRVTFEDE